MVALGGEGYVWVGYVKLVRCVVYVQVLSGIGLESYQHHHDEEINL